MEFTNWDQSSWQWHAETGGCLGPTPMKLNDWMSPLSHLYLSFSISFWTGYPPPHRDLGVAQDHRPTLLQHTAFSWHQLWKKTVWEYLGAIKLILCIPNLPLQNWQCQCAGWSLDDVLGGKIASMLHPASLKVTKWRLVGVSDEVDNSTFC